MSTNYCEVCKVSLNSEGQHAQHMAGNKHAKKLKQSQDRALTQSKDGQGQDGGEEEEKKLVFGDRNGIVSVSLDGAGNDSAYCRVCRTVLNSPAQASLHYQGAKHHRVVKAARLKEVGAITEGKVETSSHGYFFCSFCNILVNSEGQMAVHRRGARHKKAVEKQKRHIQGDLSNEPPKKKNRSAPTESIPVVDKSQILPFDQMLAKSTSASNCVESQ